MMGPQHLIADLTCVKGLDSAQTVERFMRDVIDIAGLHIRHFHLEQFSNGSSFGPGITGMALLSESHMVVHTAPAEGGRGRMHLDLFSCKPFPVDAVRERILHAFGPYAQSRWEVLAR